MQATINSIVDVIHGFGRWAATAWADVSELAKATVQHTTPAAIELIALVTTCFVIGITIYVRLRKRLHVSAVERIATNRFAAAITGFTQFQQAKMQFAKSTSLSSSANNVMAAQTRARVETKVMDVAPYNEQYMIDLLAHFKWYLKSSTPVKTKDTHLEQRGDKIYSVTETEDYIHLVFERDLGDPNIQRIKALEWEYFSIVIPLVPGYGGPILVALIGLATGPFVILIWGLCIWWSMNISKRREIAQEEIPKLRARQIEILEECDSL